MKPLALDFPTKMGSDTSLVCLLLVFGGGVVSILANFLSSLPLIIKHNSQIICSFFFQTIFQTLLVHHLVKLSTKLLLHFRLINGFLATPCRQCTTWIVARIPATLPRFLHSKSLKRVEVVLCVHSHSNACLYCVDIIQAKKSAHFLCVFMRARRCDPLLGSEKKRFHI